MARSDFPKEEFIERQTRVRRAIADAGLDWLLVFHPVSIHWLIGSDAKSYQAFQCLLVAADARPLVIITRGAERQEFLDEALIDDVRTWGGTMLAILAFQECEPCDTFAQAKKNVTATIKRVAEELGNTPAVCRKYYVHPLVLEAYTDGTLTTTLEQLKLPKGTNGLRPEEKLVIEVLRGLEG